MNNSGLLFITFSNYFHWYSPLSFYFFTSVIKYHIILIFSIHIHNCKIIVSLI